MTIYSIITARGGSKGVPQKNIRGLGGFPLIAYSIAVSKLSPLIKRTIVSTDSEEIARLAQAFGAEVPFMRPEELARDDSGDLEVILHAIKWFQSNQSRPPDYLVHLRPTTPLRSPKIVSDAISVFLKDKVATSLRSAHELAEPPEKYLRIDAKGFFKGVFPQEQRVEYYNLPRQSFAPAYHPNGYVDIIKTGQVLRNNSLHGKKIKSYITPQVTEVDTLEDLDFLEYQLEKKGAFICKYLKRSFGRGKKNVRV